MDKSNIETIRGGYGAFAKGDFASIPFDPKVEWIEPELPILEGGGMRHGPEAVIREVFEPTLSKCDNFRVQCDEYLDAGDQVIVLGRFLGRVKETGHDLNAPFAHVWTLRGGKIVRFRNYTDTYNWLQAFCNVHFEEPAVAHRY